MDSRPRHTQETVNEENGTPVELDTNPRQTEKLEKKQKQTESAAAPGSSQLWEQSAGKHQEKVPPTSSSDQVAAGALPKITLTKLIQVQF